MTDEQEEQVVSDVQATMLSAVRRSKKANIDQLLLAIEATDTILNGLPMVVEAMEELLGTQYKPIDHEGSRLGAGKMLKHMREEHGMPAEVAEEIRQVIEGATEVNVERMNAVRTLTRSIRAMAKTQATLAKYVKHIATMQLIYVSSDSCSADAAQLALKCGADGGEVVREFAKAKFPNIFDKKDD